MLQPLLQSKVWNFRLFESSNRLKEGDETGFDGCRGSTDGIPRSWFLVNLPGNKIKRRQLCVCNGCLIKQPALIELCLSGSFRCVANDGIAPVFAWGTGAKLNRAGFLEALSAVLRKVRLNNRLSM